MRLPAAWCGIATLKPSLGRIPIDPPFMGRCAGPMTRTVTDTALMMGVLSQPDARDHMSLPYQDIAWLDLDMDLRGVRIGLLLDAGCGLPVDPEILDAVQAAARLFEAAGAIVEPMKPWMTPAMLDGVDRFWRTARPSTWRRCPRNVAARSCPSSAPGRKAAAARAARPCSAATTKRQRARAHRRRLRAVRLRAVAGGARGGYNAEWPSPTNEVATTMHHIGFTLPYNMSEQPAASVNCGYTRPACPSACNRRRALRRPGRAAPGAGLGTHAPGAARLASAAQERLTTDAPP